MTTHDLSLLTDEEIRQEAEDIVEQIDAAPVESRIRALANALIAARAENERLREVADATQKAQSVLAKWIVPESNLSDADCLAALLEILDTQELVVTQRALLHSEKGGE